MIIPEGDISVLQALSEKMWLRLEGNSKHEQIRPLLLILGGMMRGVVGAGIANALTKNNFHNAFADVVGISVGAPIGAYMLANMTEAGSSIFYEECSEYFIEKMRIKRIVDIDYIVKVFRGEEGGGEKKLDVKALIRSSPNFHIGVTDVETGKGKFFNVKYVVEDIFTVITASMEYPFLYSRFVEIYGREYLDGSLGFPFPSREVIKKFNPTHILVITNCPKSDSGMRIVEGLMKRYNSWKLPTVIAETCLTRNERFEDGLIHLNESEIPSLVLWSYNKIGPLTTNSERLKKAFNDAERDMLKICSDAHMYTGGT